LVYLRPDDLPELLLSLVLLREEERVVVALRLLFVEELRDCTVLLLLLPERLLC